MGHNKEIALNMAIGLEIQRRGLSGITGLKGSGSATGDVWRDASQIVDDAKTFEAYLTKGDE
jgi:hypothetical protein